MKLLLLVSVLLGLAWAENEAPQPCDVLLPSINVPDPRVTILISDGQDQPVQEIRNNMMLKVVVMLPMSGVNVRCLLGIGLGSKWRPLMPLACQHLEHSGQNAAAVFYYTINQVNATLDERVDFRVAVIKDDTLIRTKYNGTLHYKFTGQESEDRSTTIRPSTAAPTVSTTTTLKPVVEKPEDPHDARMEANLAAKWAELQQKMAEDEDKNSEGDWQKLEEEEKRQHDAEMQAELEEYEARQAEEKKRREEMIHQEMMDKEENERLEFEEARRRAAATSTPRPQMVEDEVEPAQNGVVDLDNNGIVVADGAPSHTGLVPLLVLVVSVIAVFLM